MAFEGILKAQFESSVDKALTTGIRGAFVEGCTYGAVSGHMYLAICAWLKLYCSSSELSLSLVDCIRISKRWKY